MAGLALLNYPDLVGVLALSLSSGMVALGGYLLGRGRLLRGPRDRPPARLLYAIAPVLELALAVALVGVILAWGLEYRHLKNTESEERILQETDS